MRKDLHAKRVVDHYDRCRDCQAEIPIYVDPKHQRAAHTQHRHLTLCPGCTARGFQAAATESPETAETSL